jgi:hypothetical protein
MDHASDLRPTADGLSPADWDLLYDAVVERFRDCLCGPALERMRAAVEQGVQALDLLHAALLQERDHLRRVEAELQATRAELLVAQAGPPDGSASVRPSPPDGFASVRPSPPAWAVLCLDLDNFKPSNDRHGHDAGDGSLRTVARRWRHAVPAEDMVCRPGGDAPRQAGSSGAGVFDGQAGAQA